MSTPDSVVDRLKSYYGVITIAETFARAFVGNLQSTKLRSDESDVIERDIARYKKERAIPVYMTRAFEDLQLRA